VDIPRYSWGLADSADWAPPKSLSEQSAAVSGAVDTNRNALVCVFLRTLEYCQGIIFFTANRVKQIDDAIASRIHFKIKYDILGPDQRRGVWECFLGKATTPQGPPVYSDSGLESLVQKLLNGRQVRLPYCLYSGIKCSSSCHFRLKSHLRGPCLSSSGGSSGNYVLSGICN
jgi:hypothetical protein